MIITCSIIYFLFEHFSHKKFHPCNINDESHNSLLRYFLKVLLALLNANYLPGRNNKSEFELALFIMNYDHMMPILVHDLIVCNAYNDCWNLLTPYLVYKLCKITVIYIIKSEKLFLHLCLSLKPDIVFMCMVSIYNIISPSW